MRIPHKIGLASLSIFMLAATVGAATMSALNSDQTDQGETDRSSRAVLASYCTVSSVEELSDLADVVLIGTVESRDEIINTARNMEDLTQPDPYVYSVGRLYRVSVEGYIKGNGPREIALKQFEGIVNLAKTDVNNWETPVNIDFPNVGPRYVFFLDKSPSYPDYPADMYHPVCEPTRFKLENGRATAEGTFDEVLGLLGEMSEADLLMTLAQLPDSHVKD